MIAEFEADSITVMDSLLPVRRSRWNIARVIGRFSIFRSVGNGALEGGRPFVGSILAASIPAFRSEIEGQHDPRAKARLGGDATDRSNRKPGRTFAPSSPTRWSSWRSFKSTAGHAAQLPGRLK
jgi:hypothetical protein